MIRDKDLPIDLIKYCYIDKYDNEYCLFYKGLPLIIVNYQFWTEDIQVKADYIDNGEDEKGYSILIDMPIYDKNNNLVKIEHIYYGLFQNLADFEKWLKNPYFLY
ncbi:MAG TPA: hypothetical protein PLE45_06270 [Spirochaetota bacterium]|nr:hypothetical protein [Spirochaetota bacterium]HOL56896.1 hypothetical protein [Spirochaetota bacterium]